MRNIRNAAVASATALTLVIGGTSAAFAEDKPAEAAAENQDNKVVVSSEKDPQSSISDGTKGLFGGKGSSKYLPETDTEKPFYITDAFGDTTRPDEVPSWARYWIDGTVVAGIGALVGLIIAGFNFASYNGWINF